MGFDLLRAVVDLVSASLAAALLWLLWSRRAPLWVFLVALLLPIAALFVDAGWRVHSHHGLLHGAIVYALFDRGVPPENPLLAGEPLGYAYGHHLLLAVLMRAVPLAPPWLFAATNLVCLAATALVLERTARLLRPDGSYRALVVFLAVFGVSPLVKGALATLLFVAGVEVDGRSVPLLKFTTINSNQIGILLFSVTLHGLVRLLAARGRWQVGLGWVALGFVGSGLLYPLTWVPTAACIAAVLALLALRRSRGSETAAWGVAAVLVAGSAVVLPWILAVGTGQGSALVAAQTLSAAHLGRNAALLSAALLPPLALAWWQRQALQPLLQSDAGRGLGLCALVLAAGFVPLHLPVHSEYKVLLLCQVPLAFLLAACLERLLETRRILAAGLLLLLMLPAFSSVGRKLVFPWSVSDPATSEGRVLRHADREQRALHDWIREHLPSEAVLLDTHLSLPAFARRPLLVALDARETPGLDSDGVGLTARRWLVEVQGADAEVVERRSRLVRELLGAEPGGRPLARVAADLEAEVPGRPLYAVAREGATRKRLGRGPGAERVWEGPSLALYRLGAEEGPRSGISTWWITASRSGITSLPR